MSRFDVRHQMDAGLAKEADPNAALYRTASDLTIQQISRPGSKLYHLRTAVVLA